jgi:hypothetical protein
MLGILCQSDKIFWQILSFALNNISNQQITMKHNNKRDQSVILLALLASVTFGNAATAATVGYWTFDDGAAGATVSTLVNHHNPGFLDGTINGVGTRQLSGDVIKPYVFDGRGGPLLNTVNTTSMLFGAGGQVITPFNSALEPGQFTIEFFMKAGAQGSFPGIVEKPRVGGLAGRVTTWGVGKQNTELTFRRIDTVAAANQTTSGGASTADGQWHHFAMTYNGSTAILYRDYVPVGGNFTGILDYDGLSGLVFGGGASGGSFLPYNGLVDEIRFSNSVLRPDQFLFVPEPSRGIALLLGFVVTGMRRKR